MINDTLMQVPAGNLFDITTRPIYCNRKGQNSDHLFNLRFAYKGANEGDLQGGGIYALHYRRELLYIGIFTGKKDNGLSVPFAGNVADKRFTKHLDVMTMRGGAVGFSAGNYDQSCKLPDHPLVEAIRRSISQRGGNSVKSYPCKVRFACENWDEFSRIEHDPSILDDFTLTYGRIDPGAYPTGISYNTLRSYLEDVEARLLEHFKPRCNIKFDRPDNAKLALGPDIKRWSSLKHAIANPFGAEQDTKQAA